MGIVRMGPPTELILQLKENYKVREFVETGTFHGNTAIWAASHFQNVTTIEYSKMLYEETRAKYGDMPNINFVFGDSRKVLREIIPELASPAVFWLDSHWCGDLSYGEDDQCPLLDEIHEINKSTFTHQIFIDDARLFTSPPPLPNRIEQWPTIDRVIQSLQTSQDERYILIFDDVIIAVPRYAKGIVGDYCQRANTIRWKEHGKQRQLQKESGIKRGFRLITQGTGLIGRELLAQLKHMVAK